MMELTPSFTTSDLQSLTTSIVPSNLPLPTSPIPLPTAFSRPRNSYYLSLHPHSLGDALVSQIPYHSSEQCRQTYWPSRVSRPAMVRRVWRISGPVKQSKRPPRRDQSDLRRCLRSTGSTTSRIPLLQALSLNKHHPAFTRTHISLTISAPDRPHHPPSPSPTKHRQNSLHPEPSISSNSPVVPTSLPPAGSLDR